MNTVDRERTAGQVGRNVSARKLGGLPAPLRAAPDSAQVSPEARKRLPAPNQLTGAATANIKDTLTTPTKIKKVVDAFIEAGELKDAAPVAEVAESGEVAGQELEDQVDPLTGASASVAAQAPTTTRVIMRALGHSAKAGLGALGVVAGGVEAIYGGKELADGHSLHGATDVAGGALNVAAGVSQVSTAASDSMASGLKALGAVDEIGGRIPVAGPLVGAASVITGGVQIADALESHDTGQAITGGVKTAGGAVMIAGAFLDTTIAGAPAGIVLNGVGGAMILAGTAWDHRQALAKGLAWTGRHLAALV